MLRTWIITRLATLGFIVTVCHITQAAGPTDIARYMPAETPIYVGWSQLLETDSPDARALQMFAQAIRQEAVDDDEAALAAILLDGLGLLQTGSVGVGLFDVPIENGEPGIELAAVVDAGDRSGELSDVVRQLIALENDPSKIRSQTIKGVALQAYPLTETLTLFWGLHKECFLVAIGEQAAGRVIDCMNGSAATLADTDELKFDRRKVQAKLDGDYFCVYSDVQLVITRGKEIATELMGELPPIVDQLINELGLGAYRSKYLHIDSINDTPRMMGFAHLDGPLHGMLTLWKQKPLTEDDLKIVPQNAYWMQVNNLDLSAVWNEALRITGEVAPDAVPMVESSLAMSSGMLGFSITDDLLSAFGDTWAFFDAPDHGGFLMTGTVLVADVKDAEALQGMLARSCEMTAAMLMQSEEAGLLLRQMQYKQYTIHYVTISGIPCPVMPAWGFVHDRFVFGLYPQTVATVMKQVDPKTRGPSILDNPAFQSARAQLPPEALGIGYYDSRYFARMFYPFINGLVAAGMSMLAEYGVEIDFEMHPPLAEYAAKTTNYVGTSSSDQDGILYASVGHGAPLAFVAGSAAMATSILLPSLSRARELAKRAVSMANLRGIGQGCHIYAHDHDDEFPDSLEQLIEEGVCTPKQFLSPLDPADANPYMYINGQGTFADPRNVLAYERVRNDEGTNVLFLDGHADFMAIDEFKRTLQETYRRLDRETEIPPEFRD